MASSEQSSVVFSVQELVQVENERVLSENAEREAARARAREQRTKEQQREREHAEQQATFTREAEHREALTRETEQVRQRLIARAEVELQQARLELEREYREKSLRQSERLSALSGRQRVILAALVTSLIGAVFGWLLLVVPSERRAQADYAILKGLYEKSTQERGYLEESFGRERRQLLQRVNELLRQGVAQSNQHLAEPAPPRSPSRAPTTVSPKPKPHCDCQIGDPLCDCPTH